MMNIMTKHGSLDNIITYEHYCDTKADLINIPKEYSTLGSIAIVVQDENNELNAYIANTQKEWVPLLTGGSEINNSGITYHICNSNEISSAGFPNIDIPDESTFYLTPSISSGENNLYTEWFYSDDKWEKFGDGGSNFIDLLIDWEISSAGEVGYIANKPAIHAGTGNSSIIEGSGTTASGSSAHAEGAATTASAEGAHAEGLVSTASGMASHAEGYQTTSSGGGGSHSEGAATVASGARSHAEGFGTIAAKDSQHVFGKFNIADTDENGLYVEIVGNGKRVGMTDTRSNARTLDWSGNEWLAGNLSLASGKTLTIGSTVLTEHALQELLSFTTASGVSF